MTTHADRRSPGTNRIPFDAMVEVGGALGPTFEAQAVNLSEGGMQLRTAYLPEIGQEIHCRFDAGPADHMMVTGEVLWREDFGHGGEFGIRFRDMDPDMAASLERICGFADPTCGVGSRVRLHIDGLASPMRARIRDVRGASIIAYSELGFLQMGRSVELEDASTGERRPAHVDQVEVEVDGSSRVPQLVVSMKYDDLNADRTLPEPSRMDDHVVMPDGEGEEDRMPSAYVSKDPYATKEASAEPNEALDDADQGAVEKMRGAVARTAGLITPAVTRMASRTKTTLALLWAKRGQGADSRRVTAPPPQGVLHSTGRKVTRESMDVEGASFGERTKETLARHKTKVAAGTILLGATLIGVASMGRSPDPAKDATPATAAASPTLVSTPTATVPGIPAPLGANIEAATPIVTNLEKGSDSKAVPFTNGSVNHPKVLRVKMDGPIDKIQGAAQPSGFTVTLPGRKSLDGTSAVSGKDARIANAKLTNGDSGSEITVSFKDGVPNYQVRAKGDVLEIALDQAKSKKHPHAKHGKKKGQKH